MALIEPIRIVHATLAAQPLEAQLLANQTTQHEQTTRAQHNLAIFDSLPRVPLGPESLLKQPWKPINDISQELHGRRVLQSQQNPQQDGQPEDNDVTMEDPTTEAAGTMETATAAANSAISTQMPEIQRSNGVLESEPAGSTGQSQPKPTDLTSPIKDQKFRNNLALFERSASKVDNKNLTSRLALPSQMTKLDEKLPSHYNRRVRGNWHEFGKEGFGKQGFGKEGFGELSSQNFGKQAVVAVFGDGIPLYADVDMGGEGRPMDGDNRQMDGDMDGHNRPMDEDTMAVEENLGPASRSLSKEEKRQRNIALMDNMDRDPSAFDYKKTTSKRIAGSTPLTLKPLVVAKDSAAGEEVVKNPDGRPSSAPSSLTVPANNDESVVVAAADGGVNAETNVTSPANTVNATTLTGPANTVSAATVVPATNHEQTEKSQTEKNMELFMKERGPGGTERQDFVREPFSKDWKLRDLEASELLTAMSLNLERATARPVNPRPVNQSARKLANDQQRKLNRPSRVVPPPLLDESALDDNDIMGPGGSGEIGAGRTTENSSDDDVEMGGTGSKTSGLNDSPSLANHPMQTTPSTAASTGGSSTGGSSTDGNSMPRATSMSPLHAFGMLQYPSPSAVGSTAGSAAGSIASSVAENTPIAMSVTGSQIPYLSPHLIQTQSPYAMAPYSAMLSPGAAASSIDLSNLMSPTGLVMPGAHVMPGSMPTVTPGSIQLQHSAMQGFPQQSVMAQQPTTQLQTAALPAFQQQTTAFPEFFAPHLQSPFPSHLQSPFPPHPGYEQVNRKAIRRDQKIQKKKATPLRRFEDLQVIKFSPVSPSTASFTGNKGHHNYSVAERDPKFWDTFNYIPNTDTESDGKVSENDGTVKLSEEQSKTIFTEQSNQVFTDYKSTLVNAHHRIAMKAPIFETDDGQEFWVWKGNGKGTYGKWIPSRKEFRSKVMMEDPNASRDGRDGANSRDGGNKGSREKKVLTFYGEPQKTKKHAEQHAAYVALKSLLAPTSLA